MNMYYVRQNNTDDKPFGTLSEAREEAEKRSENNSTCLVLDKDSQIIEVWYDGNSYAKTGDDYTPAVDWDEFEYAESAVFILNELGIFDFIHARTIGDIENIRERIAKQFLQQS